MAELDVAIVGAGFGGIGMAHALRRAGIEGFTIYEKGHDVGGVWRDNGYPGAACDVGSHLYSFSFAPDYRWSRPFAPQAEILAYLRRVVRDHGLTERIRFGHAVEEAAFDTARNVWSLRFSGGATAEAEIVITAVGQLHRPKLPDLRGLDDFHGTAFHSARWRHDVELRGRRIAAFGSGASAVQFVPELARVASRLHLFQRSPGWVIPKFDRAYRGWEVALRERLPWLQRLNRLRLFCFYELVNSALQGWRGTALLLRALGRAHLRLQVSDPALRGKLLPVDPVGCKRLLLSNDWYRALTRDNVEVVTEPAREIVADGVRTADGVVREVDVLVFGTGFHATEFLAPMRVVGAEGRELGEVWRRGAEAYLGVAVADFPNLFLLYGPNSNLGVGSIVYVLERQQRYIARWVARFADDGLRRAEVRPEAQRRVNEWIQRRTARTPFAAGCDNWYRGADGRNTNNWAGFCWQYGRALRRLRDEDFRLTPAAS